MKTSLTNLDARLAAMPADELRELAANVVKLLFLVHDEENPVPVLDSDKEWDGDTLELIAEEISDAGLCPPSIALFAQKRARSPIPEPRCSSAGKRRTG